MYDLSNLQPAEGATHRRKRKGRGSSSGLGKTAGRGQKGQKSRSGGSIRPGFEGGQMPLSRRLPKRGFYNRFGKATAIVNVADLAGFAGGSVVDEESLRKARLINGPCDEVKVLGVGEIDVALTVRVQKISESARAKIVGAGGTVEVCGG